MRQLGLRNASALQEADALRAWVRDNIPNQALRISILRNGYGFILNLNSLDGRERGKYPAARACRRLSDSFVGPLSLNAPSVPDWPPEFSLPSEGDGRMQQCSTIRGALDLKLATKGLNPVEEADQSGPFADVCSADSVVLYAQKEVRIVGGNRYRHFGSP